MVCSDNCGCNLRLDLYPCVRFSMSYIKNNLLDGEDIIFEGSIHWLIFITPLLKFLIFFTCMFFSVSSGNVVVNMLMLAAALTFLVLSLASFLSALISKRTTELAITNKRVIAKSGLVKIDTMELNHSKVESFNVSQSVFGRLFGFGTLTINGTGGGHTPIQGIKDPMEFRRQAMRAIDLKDD